MVADQGSRLAVGRRPLVAAALLLAMVGCARHNRAPQAPHVPLKDSPVPVQSEGQAAPPLAPLQCAVSDVGFRLLLELAQQRAGNVAISPAAAAVALSLLHEAASEPDAARLRDLLGLSQLGSEACITNAEALREMLLRPGSGVDSRAAMAFWVPLDPPPRPAFARIARGRYKARLTALDLGQPSGRAAVDRWFAWATTGVQAAAPEPPPAGLMVAASTALIHAPWSQPFAPPAAGTFASADGSQRPVRLLRRHAMVRYFRADDVQRVDLPLGGGQVSFSLLLPDKADGLGPLLRRLSPEYWARTARQAQFRMVDLALPTLDLQDTVRLDRLLRISGLDVSRAVPGNLALGPLWLVTPLRVDENGLNAPAMSQPLPASHEPARPAAETVVATHPYVYVVSQAAGAMPLYAGVVR